jgi:hypothetical protein
MAFTTESVGTPSAHFGILLKNQRGRWIVRRSGVLRHANSKIALEVCTQATTSNKRAAQSRAVRMMVPDLGETMDETDPQKAG